MTEEKPNRETQLFAGRVLNVMSGRVTAEISSFSSWFIAGAGALLAVVLNSIATLGPYLQIGHLSGSIKLFLAAAACNVFQRWLGAMVAGSVAVGTEIQGIQASSAVDRSAALAILKESTFRPIRWWLESVQKKTEADDLVVGPRLNARLSQIQSWLVLGQFVLLGWAAWRLLLWN